LQLLSNNLPYVQESGRDHFHEPNYDFQHDTVSFLKFLHAQNPPIHPLAVKNSLVGKVETFFASPSRYNQRYLAGYLLPMSQNGLLLVSVKQQVETGHVLEILCVTNDQHFVQTGQFSFAHLFADQKKQLTELLTQDGFGHLTDRIHRTMVTTVGLKESENMRVSYNQMVMRPGEAVYHHFVKLNQASEINTAEILQTYKIKNMNTEQNIRSISLQFIESVFQQRLKSLTNYELDMENDMNLFPWYMLGAAREAFGPTLDIQRYSGNFISLTPRIQDKTCVDGFNLPLILPFMFQKGKALVGDYNAVMESIDQFLVTTSRNVLVFEMKDVGTLPQEFKCDFYTYEHDISEVASFQFAPNMLLATLSETMENGAKNIKEVAAGLLGHFMFRQGGRIKKIDLLYDGKSEKKNLEHVSIFKVKSHPKGTNLYVAFTDANINDKELLAIIASHKKFHFKSTFTENQRHEILFIDSGHKYQRLSANSIYSTETFSNGISARLYSIFNSAHDTVEISRLFWRKNAVAIQIPQMHFFRNAKNVKLISTDVIDPPSYYDDVPESIDSMIWDALTTSDRIVKLESEAEIVHLLQTSLKVFCKVSIADKEKHLLKFEVKATGNNLKTVIERSFTYSTSASGRNSKLDSDANADMNRKVNVDFYRWSLIHIPEIRFCKL